MTDNYTDASGIDSPDYGLGFSPLQQLRAVLLGPSPEMVEQMNQHLAEMSDDDQRSYGRRVATGFLADPFNEAYDADYLIAGAEVHGIKVPELVKTVARETIDAAPRDTFEQAIEKARGAAATVEDEEEIAALLDRFNQEEAEAEADEAYQNGLDTGHQFQKGWNTAQFTGEQVLALIEAEGGHLSDATERGILDAYAHYTPVEVSVAQATAIEQVAEAF